MYYLYVTVSVVCSCKHSFKDPVIRLRMERSEGRMEGGKHETTVVSASTSDEWIVEDPRLSA